MSHREIAVVIALAIPALGLLIELVREQKRLHDFRDIRKELKTLTVGLGGELDRDGDDVLVRGYYGQWPVLVRFSRSEYEAGVSVEMPVPTNLTLYCYPVTHEGVEGQTPLRTSDERFMSQFRLSTNNSPLEVSMILSSPAVLGELSKIMDSQTFLKLDNRSLELAEATIVPEHLAAKVMNCVRGMARIAAEANEVHSAGVLKPPPKKRVNWFRISYVAASALILVVLGIIVVIENRPATIAQAEAVPKNSGPAIPDALAAQIPQLQGWHIADGAEMDPDAGAWLQQQGERSTGHVTAGLQSDQIDSDAYVLKRQPGPPGTNSNRFLLFVNKQKRYDAEMPQIDAIGRISKSSIQSVEWRGRAPNGEPDADGIVVIQRYRDPSSALIFFMSGPRLMTAVPKDFRAISLQ